MGRLHQRHVHQRERRSSILLPLIQLCVIRIKAGHHQRAELFGADPGIFRQPCKTEGVIPSETALRLLRRKVIVRIRLQTVRKVNILHQTGIEADEIKLHAAVPDSFHEIAARHELFAILSLIELVRAVPHREPAAVIP